MLKIWITSSAVKMAHKSSSHETLLFYEQQLPSISYSINICLPEPIKTHVTPFVQCLKSTSRGNHRTTAVIFQRPSTWWEKESATSLLSQYECHVYVWGVNLNHLHRHVARWSARSAPMLYVMSPPWGMTRGNTVRTVPPLKSPLILNFFPA